MATKFLEPGGDATFNVAITSNGGLWTSITGAPVIATDFVHGSHIKSIQSPANSQNYTETDLVLSNSGSRISLYIYLAALPTSTNAFLTTKTGGPGNNINISITSAGVLQLKDPTLGQIGINGSTLSTGTWYRISLALTATDTTHNRFELFKNGVSDISVTNATISSASFSDIKIGNIGNDTTLDFRFSDVYVDDSASLLDTENIWVTAKRPNANGTTNGFTTQIGSSGSGYGSGHSPQVNERQLSTTNGWSMVGAGSAVTEEYSIEGQSTGDINITGGTIVDFVGWVYASSLASETGSIVLAGASSNISLTSANTMFTKMAGSTTYPAGGTDIGVITTTALTTVSLYECGIIAAFIPPPPELVTVQNPIVQGVKII